MFKAITDIGRWSYNLKLRTIFGVYAGKMSSRDYKNKRMIGSRDNK